MKIALLVVFGVVVLPILGPFVVALSIGAFIWCGEPFDQGGRQRLAKAVGVLSRPAFGRYVLKCAATGLLVSLAAIAVFLNTSSDAGTFYALALALLAASTITRTILVIRSSPADNRHGSN